MQIYNFISIVATCFNDLNEYSQIIFVFVSPYDTGKNFMTLISKNYKKNSKFLDNFEFGSHIIKHGDGAKDVSFAVENLDVIVNRARERGAKIVRDIYEESDENGTVRFAVLKTVRLYFYFVSNKIIIMILI